MTLPAGSAVTPVRHDSLSDLIYGLTRNLDDRGRTCFRLIGTSDLPHIVPVHHVNKPHVSLTQESVPQS